jgi:hypothetical protein
LHGSRRTDNELKEEIEREKEEMELRRTLKYARKNGKPLLAQQSSDALNILLHSRRK